MKWNPCTVKLLFPLSLTFRPLPIQGKVENTVGEKTVLYSAKSRSRRAFSKKKKQKKICASSAWHTTLSPLCGQ